MFIYIHTIYWRLYFLYMYQPTHLAVSLTLSRETVESSEANNKHFFWLLLLPTVMINSESEDTDLVFYDENLCGLDPLFHVHCKLFIVDVLNLSPYPTLPGAYCYKNHPIFKVDIMGIIASCQEKQKNFILGVDDGTGIISCCVWKEKVETGDNDFRSFLPESLRLKTHTLHPEFSLGEMVHIRGKIKSYKGVNEIMINYITPVSSVSAELTHMLQSPYLYKTVYDQTLVLASEVQKLQLEANEIRTGLKPLENVMRELLAKITVFNIETIKEHDIMHRIQDSLGVHESLEYVESMLNKVLKQMEHQGLICSRSDLGNSTYESLLNPKADLKLLIMDIIKKEVYNGNEYGCSLMTLRSSLEKTSQYTDISDVAVNWCLDQLETSSSIIKITNTCFMPS
ncbi:CST complex subunit STN1-like isoform X2 [Octopus sinensis]|uniref:CST complex subunit STN1 n=1 Tax=Octopus sinensis TaxID=2607531 RepID=A0A7E6FPT7_9MOLL|nr:CST complex subunit STN1-like isoform X2 [Octopus sinensis]